MVGQERVSQDSVLMTKLRSRCQSGEPCGLVIGPSLVKKHLVLTADPSVSNIPESPMKIVGVKKQRNWRNLREVR